MSDPWPRVRELFERALEMSADEARAFVVREAGDDHELRDEVLALLRQHASSGEFLEAPALDGRPELLELGSLFEAGQHVGAYEVIRELGRGGMGQVYLAHDETLDRQVAIKVVLPEFRALPGQVARLRREARAQATLSPHPGICAVYALEEVGSQIFIVSEYVDGCTLRSEIATDSRPPADEVVRTAQELAQALSVAHERGITHRDLKPENIMRTRDRHLKLLDFGLALRTAAPTSGGAGADDRLTQTGILLGTPKYMAPEQLTGGEVSTWTDVFTAGVVIYEYATGTHPFEAKTEVEVASRVLNGTPVPLRQSRPDLSSRFALVVERCLKRVPAERFATAMDLAKALAEVRQTPGEAELSPFWWRTHQAALLAVYLFAGWLAWHVKEQLDEPIIDLLLFFATGFAGVVGGAFRAHALFVERVHRQSLERERRRTDMVTMATDLALGAFLVIDGLLLAQAQPLMALLTGALGVCVGLVRLVMEPATTRATFGS